MAQRWRILVLIGLFGICTGYQHDGCKNYNLQFDRVYSVPGDVAMLTSSLVSADVFNFTTVPYNITWYNPKTGGEMTDQRGRILVDGNTLWFLNLTLDDDGEYVTIVRTPSRCYRQATKLVVEPALVGECGRPRKARQTLTNQVTDSLHCPLKDYMSKLNSYNIPSSIRWYRGCEPVVDGEGRYSYVDHALKIDRVEPSDNSSYTCTLTFTLQGIVGSVSETIAPWISAKYSLTPQVHEPGNEMIKVPVGTNLSRRCLVFVRCVGKPYVDIFWLAGENLIFSTDPSEHIYTSTQRSRKQDVPYKGVWLEKTLTINEVKEEDFHVNYTCRAYSARGLPEGYFTLLPPDPNVMVPVGSVLGSVMFLFVVSVVLYYLFKVEIVLWFRRAFPILYTNTDSDGKLYDAYVAYAQPCAAGFSEEVEVFALQTLPRVLEKEFGYKLFIAGRDCTPGKAIVDSVEENIQASRRFLLLYTASTFSKKRSSSSNNNNNNNNNDVRSSDDGDGSEGNTSFEGGEEEKVYQDPRQQLECVAAMHRALLERSLKVILVELEQISPAQLALFPEAVRHLRKKQGAVCWWKNRSAAKTWRTCTKTSGRAETPSLSPSSRFWKEMRYRMPVRGKRAVYPEKTALLNV